MGRMKEKPHNTQENHPQTQKQLSQIYSILPQTPTLMSFLQRAIYLQRSTSIKLKVDFSYLQTRWSIPLKWSGLICQQQQGSIRRPHSSSLRLRSRCLERSQLWSLTSKWKLIWASTTNASWNRMNWPEDLDWTIRFRKWRPHLKWLLKAKFIIQASNQTSSSNLNLP